MSRSTRLISLAAVALASAGALLFWPPGVALAAITGESQASTGLANAATSLTIPKPSAAGEGDFLLAQITVEKGSDVNITAPTNWTFVRWDNQSTNIRQAIYGKFVGASEPTSYTWNFSQSVKAAGGILAYSGVDLNPIVAHSGAVGTSGNLIAPGVAAETDSKLVAYFGVKKDTNLSTPTGMTHRYQAESQEYTNKAADQDVAAGATGTRTSNPGESAEWVAQLVALRSAPEAPLDTDGDDMPDDQDNCPDDPNPDQADADNDGIGDACEPDRDDDGIIDDNDNCPEDPNSNQADNDNDGIGDACDTDGDNDGVNDNEDNCPLDSNPDQADADGDGLGDVCDSTNDTDSDGDGVTDGADLCLDTPESEVVDGTGCSIAQLCPCDNQWKNHGAYVSCVAKSAEDFLDLGFINETEKDAIVSEAGQSQCGSKK